MFINFSILNIMCGPIRIVYLNNVLLQNILIIKCWLILFFQKGKTYLLKQNQAKDVISDINLVREYVVIGE
jgi:hypothetical protein